MATKVNGRMEKIYRVTCDRCAMMADSSEETMQGARFQFVKAGWFLHPSMEWTCPACRTKPPSKG